MWNAPLLTDTNPTSGVGVGVGVDVGSRVGEGSGELVGTGLGLDVGITVAVDVRSETGAWLGRFRGLRTTRQDENECHGSDDQDDHRHIKERLDIST